LRNEHQFEHNSDMASNPATTAEVIDLLEQVHDVCGRLEPGNVPLHAAPQVFDALASAERLIGGAVLRMAGRYEEAGEWKRNGAKSAEDDIARKTGTPTGAARKKLSTSKRLKKQQRTDEAIRNGDLSAEQANEVSSGADASPEDEDDLLDTARRHRLAELRKRAADARAKADRDREDRRRRHQAMRSVRRWTDEDGMGNLCLRLPPEDMATVDAALKPRIDRAFADARQAGRFEPVERYAADVVRDLLTGAADGTPARRSQAVRPDKKVIALIDLAALNRGAVEGDETCEIAGVGPVSVSAVRALLADAFLAVVIKDGIDILHVTHLGRRVTAAQRTALEARSGGACEVCGSRYLLDIDHNEGWTLTHETRIDDLSWFCWHCHGTKTRHDLRVEGPVGARWFVDRKTGQRWHPPPDDPREPPATDASAADSTQAELFTFAD
jgi:hypothetical protein